MQERKYIGAIALALVYCCIVLLGCSGDGSTYYPPPPRDRSDIQSRQHVYRSEPRIEYRQQTQQERRRTCPLCNGRGKLVCPGGFLTPCTNGIYDPCPQCHGSGKLTSWREGEIGGGPCKVCFGRGKVICPKCGGRGEIICSRCNGMGTVSD